MKPCAICGTPHARRPTDTATQYKRRQCCSTECSKKLISTVKTKYDTPDKTCAVCDKPFSLRPGEKPVAYRDRTTCSRSCALTLGHARHAGVTPAEWHAMANAPRSCEVCGAAYHRRKREPVRDWKRRKHCSNACSSHSRAARDYRASIRKAPKAKAIARKRMDPRPETTPMKAWNPPTRAASPKPDPVPTAKPLTPPRPAQSLLRQIHDVFATHPELRAILDGRHA